MWHCFQDMSALLASTWKSRKSKSKKQTLTFEAAHNLVPFGFVLWLGLGFVLVAAVFSSLLAQNGLEFTILLLQPLQCWDYRYVEHPP